MDFGLLFYRSDIVSEQDGAKLESGDYTWDDLLGMAQAYAGQGGTQSGMVFPAAQYEGLICTLNEFTNGFTDTRSGLETMKTFIDSQAVPEEVENYKDDEARDSFLGGETVFCRNWPYVWGEAGISGEVLKEQVGVAPMPEGCCIGGWLLAKPGFLKAAGSTVVRPVSDKYTTRSEEAQRVVHKYLSGSVGLDQTVSDLESAFQTEGKRRMEVI